MDFSGRECPTLQDRVMQSPFFPHALLCSARTHVHVRCFLRLSGQAMLDEIRAAGFPVNFRDRFPVAAPWQSSKVPFPPAPFQSRRPLIAGRELDPISDVAAGPLIWPGRALLRSWWSS